MALVYTYDKGDEVRLRGEFTDIAGNHVDPTAVFVITVDPSENETTYTYGQDDELTRESEGIYNCLINADESGTWYYRFYSTGTRQGAGEHRFIIRSSNVPTVAAA
jgi:hypothetical protein